MEWLVVTVPLNMEVKAADFRSQLETPHVACRCVYPAGMSTQLLQTPAPHTMQAGHKLCSYGYGGAWSKQIHFAPQLDLLAWT